MHTKSINVLGVSISIINYSRTLQIIQKVIEMQRKEYICVCAVNQVMEGVADPKLLEGMNDAFLRVPDGMPLVWLQKRAGFIEAERVYGVTLTEKLCDLAQKKKWRVFLLGGARGQSDLVRDILTKRYSKLLIVGNVDTPNKAMSSKQNQRVLEQIKKSKADIVLVGMGCPYQEKWMIENRSKLNAPLLIGVGAVFDYTTGKIKKTPEWVKNHGLEWLFRLAQEPRRLWHRYTIQNIKFIFLLMKESFVKASQ